MSGIHRIVLADATRKGIAPKSAITNAKYAKVTGLEKQPIKKAKKK